MRFKCAQVSGRMHTWSTDETGVHGRPAGVQGRPPHLPHQQKPTQGNRDVEMPATDQHDKEFTALDINARIPRGARWEGRRSGGSGGGGLQVWTFLLLCLVLTLVLINDMVTYGHLDEAGSEVVSHPPMQVVVYYEALCPDSRYFVLKQLVPTYEKLHTIMTISFVPYGKAQTTEKDGKYVFTCQHGPVECRANMVHACVTNVVHDEAKQLNIISCMIDKNDQPVKVGEKCMEKFGEPWSDVAKCVDSDKGPSILKHMGDMTHSLRPRVTFIPTVEIDGSLSEQSQIQQNLLKVLCRRYKGPKPPSC